MNEELSRLSRRFLVEKERFYTGCDAQEELENWDLEEYGEMDVYYESVLVGTLLRMIARDGVISAREQRFLEEIFEMDYSTEQLQQVVDGFEAYESNEAFCENLKRDLDMAVRANAQLGALFREMLGLACRIILAFDGADERERALAGEIMAAI